MAEKISVKPVLDVFPEARLGDRLKKLPLLFGIGIIVIALALVFFARLEKERLLAKMQSSETDTLRLIKFVIARDLQDVGGDLLALSRNESLSDYLRYPSSFNRELATGRFKSFSRERKVYSQVRFLSSSGDELIRINKRNDMIQIVPPSGLQNKGNRYYFRDAISMKAGEIFVSPLDLNMEQGKLERPIVPTMRFATPVFDDSGHVRGVVVLNYRAEILLQRFSELFPQEDNGRFWLLNRDGYWLKADNKTREWGFVLDKSQNIKKHYSRLWEAMQTEAHSFLSRDGLFTFTTLDPLREIGADTVLSNQRIRWHLVLFLSSDNYSLSAVLKANTHLLWLLIPLSLLVFAGCYHLASVLAKREKMQEALHLLATGIEQSPSAVVISDTEGYIRYANPKFERMTGYDRKEITGEHTRLFKSGATRDAVYRALWKTITSGRIWKGDFENRHKNGNSYYVSAQIAPIFTKSGKIDSFLALQEDVTEKKRLEQELEAMATKDGLTEVNNRRQFLKLLDMELERSVRYGQALSILSFDLDFFKDINDNYGHHAGDIVLKNFAGIISAQLRDNDFIGRLGGEEFAAVLVGTELPGGIALAERLRKVVEEMVIECDGQLIRVTVSIGLTGWKNGEQDIDEILKRADKALYRAKNSGRNKVICFEEKEQRNWMTEQQ